MKIFNHPALLKYFFVCLALILIPDFLIAQEREPDQPPRGEEMRRREGNRPNQFRRERPQNGMFQAVRNLAKDINILDRTDLEAALALWESEEREKAVELATKLSQSKHPKVQGIGALLAGIMWQQMEKPEEAKSAFLKTKGKASAVALLLQLSSLQKERNRPDLEPDLVLDLYNGHLEKQDNALDRCRLLKTLVEWLDRPMPGMPGMRRPAEPQPNDKNPQQIKAEILTKVAKSISREDADACHADLQKEEPITALVRGNRNPIMARRMGGEGDADANRRRNQMMGRFGQGQRDRMLENFEKRVQELREQGQEEQAEQMEKRLRAFRERMDRGGDRRRGLDRRPEPPAGELKQPKGEEGDF